VPQEDTDTRATAQPRYPTATGFYVCNVPTNETGSRGEYGYVLLVGLDCDPTGPWVKVIGSDRRIHAKRCTSWTNMLPAPAGRAHRMFGRFGDGEASS
jgi:hypothetical protein